MMFDDLPDDITLEILQSCDILTLANLVCVNKKFHELGKTEMIPLCEKIVSRSGNAEEIVTDINDSNEEHHHPAPLLSKFWQRGAVSVSPNYNHILSAMIGNHVLMYLHDIQYCYGNDNYSAQMQDVFKHEPFISLEKFFAEIIHFEFMNRPVLTRAYAFATPEKFAQLIPRIKKLRKDFDALKRNDHNWQIKLEMDRFFETFLSELKTELKYVGYKPPRKGCSLQ